MNEFKVGDVVEWTSQAQGSWKTKRGTIVQSTKAYAFRGAKEMTQMVHVEVKPPLLKNGKPSTAKPTYYWPRLSNLKHVSEVA